MRTLALPVALLIAITALRFYLASVLEVTPLEAYYWMCANQLDGAFFDGPAGTAFLVRLGFLGPGDDPLGLRIAFPIAALIATVGAYLVGRRWFNPTVGIWAAAGLNLLPFFNFASFHAGPDMPALAAILLAIWAAMVAFDRGVLWWLACGVFLMIAVQFRYDAALALPGLILACTTAGRFRKEFRRPGLYLAAILTAAGFVPAILWNQAHDWAPLARGTVRTALTIEWNRLGSAFGTIISTLSIPVLLGIVAGLLLLASAARSHLKPRWLLAFTAPFLAAAFYWFLRGESASLMLLVSAACTVPGLLYATESLPLARWACAVGALASAAITGLAISSPVGPAADPWRQSSAGIPWLRVAAAIETIIEESQKTRTDALFIIAQNPDATAALNYHLPRLAEGSARTVFLRESQDLSNQFGLWPRYDDFVETERPPDEFFTELKAENPYVGRSAIYVSTEAPDLLPQTIRSAFVRVTPIATIDVSADRDLHVYLCEDYQTMPL